MTIRSRPGCAARVRKEHECEQPSHLALPWHELVERSGQPCGLSGEVGALQGWTGAGRVALVEDEIEDVHHHAESIGALCFRGQVEAWAAAPDAFLGTADALRHRRFRNQEGAR